MVKLKIGAVERRFDIIADIDENWINQQIKGLKRDGHTSCVRVSINEGSVSLSLATADCSSSGGGGRLPNDDENRIFELWNRLGLNEKDFSGGKFVAFFKQARSIIR